MKCNKKNCWLALPSKCVAAWPVNSLAWSIFLIFLLRPHCKTPLLVCTCYNSFLSFECLVFFIVFAMLFCFVEEETF